MSENCKCNEKTANINANVNVNAPQTNVSNGGIHFEIAELNYGSISLKGLKAGTYTLKETKAPSGYNLDPTEYKVVLGLNQNPTFDNAKITMTSSTPAGKFEYEDSTAKAKITIDNKSGTVLPGTGGIGTTIFYVLGTALLIGCGVVLVSKRRMSKEK